MSSDLEIAVQYLAFVLQWFLGWLADSPYVLLIILTVGGGTVLTWKLLMQMKPPPILSSPKISIILLLVMLMVVVRSYTISNQLLLMQNDLDTAHWRIRQGSQHRIELLNQMEKDKMERKLVGGEEGSVEEEDVNPLDDCLHVFIDLGSNRGLQIRKLYEPHTFPLAPIQPVYQKFFGKPEDRNLQEICSVMTSENISNIINIQCLKSGKLFAWTKVDTYQLFAGTS